MNDKCSLCGSVGYIIEHHTSYIPEKKIDVCVPCHKKLHKDSPELKPPDGFYQKIKNGRARATILVDEDLYLRARHAAIENNKTFSEIVTESLQLNPEVLKVRRG